MMIIIIMMVIVVVVIVVTFSTAFAAFSQSTMRQVLRRSIAFSASRHRLMVTRMTMRIRMAMVMLGRRIKDE